MKIITDVVVLALMCILLFTACGHHISPPEPPPYDSGFTADGHQWWYQKQGGGSGNGVYLVYAEELEALTEVQFRICNVACTTTDIGGDMYEIKRQP